MRPAALDKIRKELFYGSSEYTKNQPDLFVPHRFQMLAPSQAGAFLETVRNSLIEEEILLYVHLPFCFSECKFCNSFPHNVDKEIQKEYIGSLVKEIDIFCVNGLFDGKKAKGIYFGGGTPTSFSSDDIKLILDKIRSGIALSENCSVTSEAHPGTLTGARIDELASIGITRLSIGCQSFDDQVLAHCNRNNTASQVKHIVDLVHDAHMAINIDMMTGLPGQSMESVRADLEILEEIRPDSVEYIRHEIVNPLIVELYKSRPDLVVADDDLFEMVLMTQEWMERLGYEQNGRFSNDLQWGYRYHWLNEMPIIAFGARTRSYSKTICYDKHEDLVTYSRLLSKGIAPIGRHISLSKRERMYRSFILGIQLLDGIDIEAFRQTHGEDPRAIFGPLLEKLEECGCIGQDGASIRLTKYGAYFVEDVCDYVIDTALKEEAKGLVRAPHSEGGSSSRLTP